MTIEHITLAMIGGLCGIVLIEGIILLIHDWKRRK